MVGDGSCVATTCRGSLAEERVGSVGHSSREGGFSAPFVEVVGPFAALLSGTAKEWELAFREFAFFEDFDYANAGLLRLPPCMSSCLGPFV